MIVSESIAQSLEKIGGVEFMGVKLEDADIKLLDISKLTTDIHSTLQAPGLAYYGSLLKRARRTVEYLTRDYARWRSRKIAASMAVLLASSNPYKPTKDDCEARFQADNAPEIADWDEKVKKANEIMDDLESWYEAFRAKGFQIKDMSGWDKDELIATGDIIKKQASTGSQSIRNLLRQ